VAFDDHEGRSIPALEESMRVKRHHLLLGGLLLFFAGVQFRLVESFTLSERSSHFVSAQLGNRGGMEPQTLWQNMPSRKVVKPPRWLGLALMSVGSVLTLKSLSMKNAG
jgi:hypothetical protein